MKRAHLEAALRILLAHRHSRAECVVTRSLIHQTIRLLRTLADRET